jgi:RHS repeat-associated protein
MRFLLLFLSLFLQVSASGDDIHVPRKSYAGMPEGTFVPAAKITEKEQFSTVTNYLGTPEAMYREDGETVWTCGLNSYRKVRNFQGESKTMCPFRYRGQYEDAETGLYYNRFRYYSLEEGMYLSQDPIGLMGGSALYAYIYDSNSWVDVFGLKSNSVLLAKNSGKGPVNHAAHHIVMTGTNDTQMNSLVTQMRNHNINPDGKLNGIWLPVKDSDKVKGGANTSHQQDGLHGEKYKEEIFNRLNGKNKKEFRNELKKIKKELEMGRIFETSTTKNLGKTAC